MEENQNKRVCENCRYYLAHYIMADTRFFKIACGHCVNEARIDDRSKKRAKNIYKLEDGCTYWEPIELKRAERREAIKEVLGHMQKSLAEIASVLKEDKD